MAVGKTAGGACECRFHTDNSRRWRPGGSGGWASAINNDGEIAGCYNGKMARIWQDGTQIRLGSLAGIAYAINDAGIVVGYEGDDAVAWQNNVLTALPGGSDGGCACAINNRGEVVGWDSAGNAVLWTSGPFVTLTVPTTSPTYFTTSPTVTLSGTASACSGITQMSWSNNAGGSGTCAGAASWSAAGIPLQLGYNVITVTATDSIGNSASAQLTVVYDPTPPSVAITSPTTDATYTTACGIIALSGTASDNVGVASVTWSNSRAEVDFATEQPLGQHQTSDCNLAATLLQ